MSATVVRVNLPGYTVDLHFYPGAGSSEIPAVLALC